MNFNDFYWHDAIVKNIQIDGISSGDNGIITFEIKWPDGELDESIFTFEGVYLAVLKLNFGIIATESIRTADELSLNDSDLLDLHNEYGETNNNIGLRVYSIDLNSTGGKIKIIARSFKVHNPK